MSNSITQDQLELCRLGMMIARLQLKAMAATAVALSNHDAAEGYASLETSMEELSKQIFNGEIKGTV